MPPPQMVEVHPSNFIRTVFCLPFMNEACKGLQLLMVHEVMELSFDYRSSGSESPCILVDVYHTGFSTVMRQCATRVFCAYIW